MLELRNLSKTFYQRTEEISVVKKISLRVKKGEVFGFLGLNGAGKTTTVKMIVGLLFPDSGSIKIRSLPSTDLAAKRVIGFMPETPQFYQHLKVFEVLELVGQLFDLDQATIIERTDDLLKKVSLYEAKNWPARKLSKGMHQRLSFATALMNNPALLILDEPLDGLDPLGRLDFKRLIKGLKKQGVTIFFSSHILSDVEELCDQVAVIDRGQIIAQGSPKQLTGRGKSLEEIFVEIVKR